MTREKIIAALKDVTDKYLHTDIDGELKGKHFPNNLVFMTLSYILDRNHLLIGDPGWAKTTAVQALASKLSGIPLDLYESLTMHGNPGVFEEKLIGRPDFGQLATGKESVIWQGGFGLDALVIDEISRVPPGTQALLLEGIRTGRWSYMNATLYEGKKPTFLTMNYADEGNGRIIPPLEDRIDIVTEQKPVAVFCDFQATDQARDKDLANHEATEQALDALKAKNYPAFKAAVEKTRKKDTFTPAEKKAVQAQIDKMKFHNEANYLLWAFQAEINYNDQYGFKRSADKISPATHDKNYAGINVTRSFSARPQIAARLYSKAIAWLLGDKEVQLDHVRYVLPYVSAHRLGFTSDYRNKHGNENRTDYEDLHLAKQLVADVYKTYQQSVQPLANLIARIQKKETIDPKELSGHDHPLLKHLIYEKINKAKSDLW